MTTGTISIIVGVVLLILLKVFFKDDEKLGQKGFHGIEDDDLFEEDPMIDPGFSLLSGNIYNDDK